MIDQIIAWVVYIAVALLIIVGGMGLMERKENRKTEDVHENTNTCYHQINKAKSTARQVRKQRHERRLARYAD